jgi:hypothetical protein
MSESTIWISYDLGVRGDYEGLYAWLDNHKAKECGDSLALLRYEYSGNLLEALTTDLKSSVEINKRTRFYVIHRDKTTKLMKGTFIHGGRKSPPWAGFSGEGKEQEDDE